MSPKLHRDGILWGVVTTLLAWKDSPQEIAGTLRRVHPDRPELHVSHETIYTAIDAHARGELRRQLMACLRHGHAKRMPRSRGNDRRGQSPERVSIHVRPPEIEDRLMTLPLESASSAKWIAKTIATIQSAQHATEAAAKLH